MTLEDRKPEGFSVDTTFGGAETKLTVRGDIDGRTSLELGNFLDAAIELGHRFIVVDLAQVEFIDGSGLRTIARAAHQLSVSSGALTIRSPSCIARRLLEIVGLDNLVTLELPDSPLGRRSSEQPIDRPAEIMGTRYSGTAKSLPNLTGIHSDSELIDAALHLAVILAAAAVGGADGASVSLLRSGRLATVAATDQTISMMDTHQYATGEGPCIDTSVQGRRFHAKSLTAEPRWPTFAPRARSLGINAILSSPLLVQDRPVGALNIYSRTPAAFAPKDQKLATVFASNTSLILSGVGVDEIDGQHSNRFQEALRGRELIAQAQGVLMERHGIGENDAYNTLRRASLESGRPLRQHARDIVTSTGRTQPERASRTPGSSDG